MPLFLSVAALITVAVATWVAYRAQARAEGFLSTTVD